MNVTSASSELRAPLLYAITDPKLMPGEVLTTKAKAALKAGVGWLQYRDKSIDHTKRLREALALKKLCDEFNAQLIINDDIQLAKQVCAAGVHLGQGDDSVQQARQILGNEAIIGVTCHASIKLAQKAASDGASYVAFGRFFPSKTKPDAPSADLDIIQQAKIYVSLPIVVIGGITSERSHTLLNAGADTLAICDSLFNTDDVESRTKEFLTTCLR